MQVEGKAEHCSQLDQPLKEGGPTDKEEFGCTLERSQGVPFRGGVRASPRQGLGLEVIYLLIRKTAKGSHGETWVLDCKMEGRGQKGTSGLVAAVNKDVPRYSSGMVAQSEGKVGVQDTAEVWAPSH